MQNFSIDTKIKKLQNKIDNYIEQEKRVVFQTFRVIKQGFLSPFLFRKVEELNEPIRAIFKKESNTISLINGSNDETFIFDEDNSIIESFFNENREYKLIFSYDGRNFYVAKEEDYKKFLEETKKQKEIRELKRMAIIEQAKLIEQKIKTEFWAQYDIPFKFAVGIKPVKSGFGERSACNGSNRATVYHIILDEDISIGKLKRKKGNYLCSQLNWIPYAEIEPYRENLPVITCKECLKRIKKFKNEAKKRAV